MAELLKVKSLADVPKWLAQLGTAPAPRTTGAWPLVAVLDHLAQSVEMSLDGFPRSRGAVFQHTAGAAAFAVFKWREKMSHSLTEPIPGAPPLQMTGDWRATAERLRAALARFDVHQGALQPHFAYGALSKPDYAKAHAFHIANHQDEIVAE